MLSDSHSRAVECLFVCAQVFQEAGSRSVAAVRSGYGTTCRWLCRSAPHFIEQSKLLCETSRLVCARALDPPLAIRLAVMRVTIPVVAATYLASSAAVYCHRRASLHFPLRVRCSPPSQEPNWPAALGALGFDVCRHLLLGFQLATPLEIGLDSSAWRPLLLLPKRQRFGLPLNQDTVSKAPGAQAGWHRFCQCREAWAPSMEAGRPAHRLSSTYHTSIYRCAACGTGHGDSTRA